MNTENSKFADVNGLVQAANVIKEGVGKKGPWKILKVIVEGNEFKSFDTAFLNMVGQSGEFIARQDVFNGKVTWELMQKKENARYSAEPKTTTKASINVKEQLTKIYNQIGEIITEL